VRSSIQKVEVELGQGGISTQWSVKERQNTNLERTRTMGYYQVIGKSMTTLWKEARQDYGKKY